MFIYWGTSVLQVLMRVSYTGVSVTLLYRSDTYCMKSQEEGLEEKDGISSTSGSFSSSDPKLKLLKWNLWTRSLRLPYSTWAMLYWKIENSIFDFLICFGHFWSFEGWSACHHGETNHSSWPNIHLIWMSSASSDNLGSYVIRSSTHRSFSFLLELQLSSQPKVSYFDLHTAVKKNICHF